VSSEYFGKNQNQRTTGSGYFTTLKDPLVLFGSLAFVPMLGWSRGRVFGIFGLHWLYVFVPGVKSAGGLVQNLRVTLDKGPRSRIQ